MAGRREAGRGGGAQSLSAVVGAAVRENTLETRRKSSHNVPGEGPERAFSSGGCARSRSQDAPCHRLAQVVDATVGAFLEAVQMAAVVSSLVTWVTVGARR